MNEYIKLRTLVGLVTRMFTVCAKRPKFDPHECLQKFCKENWGASIISKYCSMGTRCPDQTSLNGKPFHSPKPTHWVVVLRIYIKLQSEFPV